MSKPCRIDIRVDEHIKAEYAELAAIRGTTVSRMLQEYIASEVMSLPREKRRTAPKPTNDFLD